MREDNPDTGTAERRPQAKAGTLRECAVSRELGLMPEWARRPIRTTHLLVLQRSAVLGLRCPTWLASRSGGLSPPGGKESQARRRACEPHRKTCRSTKNASGRVRSY